MAYLPQIVAITFIFVLLTSGLPNNFPNITKEAVATQTIFQDDYSSSIGWTQIGSLVTVNSPSFPGVAYFNNVFGGGGVTQDRVFKQLPSTLPGTWTADFDYKFTQSSIPAFLVFDLTTTSDDPQLVPQANRILIEHGNGVDKLFITSSGSGADTAGIPILPNVQYYVRLDKTPTQLMLNVFSDPTRTIQVPGSPVSTNIAATDFSNLNFIQHDGCMNCGPARTLTADIDNTIIYTVTAVCQDDDRGEQESSGDHGNHEDNGNHGNHEDNGNHGDHGDNGERGKHGCGQKK